MISVIIPFYNEKESIPVLYDELPEELDKLGQDYEIIFVDDGSDDGSDLKNQILNTEGKKKESAKFLSHRRRLGKGAALSLGYNTSRGDIIVFMDGDLQDDPRDLPIFLEKIESGYDFVNGVRTTRKDNPVIKLYSALGNAFLKSLLKSPFTDVNCGYKVFKREVLDEVVLYANNFRFLPIAAYLKGFKVTEVAVHNHPRRFGKSKFGMGKVFLGFFDTFTAYFIYRFSEAPLHFFGPVGTLIFSSGFILCLYLTFEKLFYGVQLFRRPALLLGVLLIIVGLQVILTGVIGELMVYLNKKSAPKTKTQNAKSRLKKFFRFNI